MPYLWLLSPPRRRAVLRAREAAAAEARRVDAEIDRQRAELLEESDEAGRQQFAGGRAVGARTYP